MNHNIYLYIFVMALVTYLIRMLPITLIKKEIKNTYLRSFLFYIPFVTLSVMTFPAILYSTSSIWSALGGLFVAILFAYRGFSLIKIAGASCLIVFIIEIFI